MPNIPIAVLISSGGTTLKNLIQWQRLGELKATFSLVISSNPNARGLEFATEAGIPIEVVSRKSFTDSQSHAQAVFEKCRQRDVKLVVMGGFLEHLQIPSDFENRVINIHPSLIPSFCGKGFYGLRVHQAALEMGVKVTGCTVHFVDNQYDHGPIIAQRACQVLDVDTAETLQSRVFELECNLYPEVINTIARNRVQVVNNKVFVRAMM